MFYKALLFLLPTVTYAQKPQIKISIKALDQYQINNQDTLEFKLDGPTDVLISDTERRTWKITDDQLKDLVSRCSFKNSSQPPRPDHVFVRSPTTSGSDKYKTGDVQEVHRILRPSSHIFKATVEPVVLATKEYYNRNEFTTMYELSKMKQSVVETLSTKWDTDGELSIGDVGYEFMLGKWGLPDISFTGSWGRKANISKTATIVSRAGGTLELKPGELGLASLIAFRGMVNIDLEIKATLSGEVLSNYVSRKEIKQRFLFSQVNDLLSNCRMRPDVISSVSIRSVFYADIDAQILVTKKYIPIHFNRTSNRINF